MVAEDKPRDTFHVVLFNPQGQRIERILDTWTGGIEAREDAVSFADQLSRLKEQMIMLGVSFSAPYEIRVQQVRRDDSGPLYGGKRTRWLTKRAEPDADAEAKFWGDAAPAPALEQSVARTIETGQARLDPHVALMRQPSGMPTSLCVECSLPESDPLHIEGERAWQRPYDVASSAGD